MPTRTRFKGDTFEETISTSINTNLSDYYDRFIGQFNPTNNVFIIEAGGKLYKSTDTIPIESIAGYAAIGDEFEIYVHDVMPVCVGIRGNTAAAVRNICGLRMHETTINANTSFGELVQEFMNLYGSHVEAAGYSQSEYTIKYGNYTVNPFDNVVEKMSNHRTTDIYISFKALNS